MYITDIKEPEFEIERKIYEVYNVRDDKNGYPHFLIYTDKEWKYVSAKNYKPYNKK